MPGSLLSTARCALAACGAVLLLLAPSQAARAETESLQMRVDGIAGGGVAKPVLGADAFPLIGFTVTVGDDASTAVTALGAEALRDVDFTMSVGAPVVPLWQLAVQGKVVPKASLVALDSETGKIRYRADLEQVVVRNIGLQTLGGTREAVVGRLGYERIRLSYGEGKNALSAGWDRVRNAPWK